MSLASSSRVHSAFHCPCGATDAGQLAGPGDVEFTRLGLARRHIPATG